MHHQPHRHSNNEHARLLTCCCTTACPAPANAADYDQLLARHQELESEASKARERVAEMRSRLDGLTGPSGPQARLRQLEGQLQQVNGGSDCEKPAAGLTGLASRDNAASYNCGLLHLQACCIKWLVSRHAPRQSSI